MKVMLFSAVAGHMKHAVDGYKGRKEKQGEGWLGWRGEKKPSRGTSFGPFLFDERGSLKFPLVFFGFLRAKMGVK